MTNALAERAPERGAVWTVLENPSIYRWAQRVLAPGAEKSVNHEIEQLVNDLGTLGLHLDIGCGPVSFLWRFKVNPIGIDLASSYTRSFYSRGGRAVTGSATVLPFCDSSFDVVWNFGLMHHLSDGMALCSLSEMMRVVKPGGSVIVFDGVMPRFFWSRPMVWLLRKLDRGRHMRTQEALESILSERNGLWSLKRFTYSWWGHEGLLCRFHKPERS